MHQRQRPALFCKSAKQRQRNPVLAAERDEMFDDRRPAARSASRLAANVAERNAKSRQCRQMAKRGGIDPKRMSAIDQHAARLSDRRRPETGPAAIRGADVETECRRCTVASLRSRRSIAEESSAASRKSRVRSWVDASGFVKRNTAAANRAGPRRHPSPFGGGGNRDDCRRMRLLISIDFLRSSQAAFEIELDPERGREHVAARSSAYSPLSASVMPKPWCSDI